MEVNTRPAFLLLRDDKPFRAFTNHKWALQKIAEYRARDKHDCDWELFRIPLDYIKTHRGRNYEEKDRLLREGKPK